MLLPLPPRSTTTARAHPLRVKDQPDSAANPVSKDGVATAPFRNQKNMLITCFRNIPIICRTSCRCYRTPRMTVSWSQRLEPDQGRPTERAGRAQELLQLPLLQVTFILSWRVGSNNMVAREFQLSFGFFVKWECQQIHGADGLDLVVGLSMPWLHINTTTSRKSLVPVRLPNLWLQNVLPDFLQGHSFTRFERCQKN
nr:uncharacterized protein LOC127295412 [Lolium perenne]XP_051181312.1 uncharacterized protein LOC127295412 [Lolium perenne]XP_051181313.1 uncharacterized protein LOC127295412 [Lolium perenne]XP_051181314.1 uncharacterized protein LOC127295412 [Lolium perenne]